MKFYSKTNIIKHNYLIINLIFIVIILLIFSYSIIFSKQNDNYPIECIHKQITGKICATCGLSHSFSEIVRGNFKEAKTLNENGIYIFAFFFIQLITRLLVSAILILNFSTINYLIVSDSIFSFLLFLLCFQNLFVIW